MLLGVFGVLSLVKLDAHLTYCMDNKLTVNDLG
jgi:hypothetical protein